jgi:DNA topoisomerase IA
MYWTVGARLVSNGGEHAARLFRSDSNRLPRADAEAAARALTGKTGTVAKAQTKAEKEPPPRRFNLNEPRVIAASRREPLFLVATWRQDVDRFGALLTKA